MSSYLELNNVCKTIKGQMILNHISLQLEKGGIYGFIGRNGSGKSMLFKAICGFLSLDQGTIQIGGKQLEKEIDFPPSVGMIIEKPALIPYRNGLDNLKLLASIRKEITEEKIRDAMALVELDPDSRKKVRAYSLGMKQRLAIAQAVMEEPELLILDEPMNALDQQMVARVKHLLKNEQQRGCTILLCSHIAGDVEELCDHLYEIENGSVTELW